MVLYVDECHLQWDDVRGRLWGPKGECIQISIADYREKQTYYGAIDAVSGEMIVIPTKCADSYWTMIFVGYLQQEYPEKQLVLVWDGASYHKGREMQEYLEAVNWNRSREEWPVTCLLFAPYAPEQNPIEDVWLKAKTYLRNNWHRCRNFTDIRAIFEEALNTLSFQFEKLSLYIPFLQMI